MSVHGSSFNGSLRGGNESSMVKWWTTVREVLFGVMYTMAKENTLPKYFVLANVIIEFIQMIVFCFRPEYHWSGVHISADVDMGIIGYDLYTIFFWIVVSALVLAGINVSYIGYSFHQGEVRSIFLLRTLRWICALFVTVLFIPILYVMLSGLACDYTSTPARLMVFPDVECWGSKNFAVGMVASLLLAIFALFSLFTGLMYYEYDPTVVKAASRLQNRFDFGALWIKMLLVFMSLFLQSHAVVFAIVSFFSMLILFVSYLVMLPAYDQKINLIRCGSYAGIFWVYLCTLIAIAISDSNNYASVVALGIGTPCAIAIGVFLADRRFKYVCNPRLVDGFVASEENLVSTTHHSKSSSKKVVKWEQPRVNKLLKNQLYNRLLVPTDVEIASRFVLTANPNAALVDKAKAVFQTGLSKFPKSPSVLQAYANFLFYVVGDWQLGYLALEKVRKMKPPIDIQFFIYRHDKDREQRTEGGKNAGSDFVDFMEFKKLHQAAKRHHMTALVCIRKFWRNLLESKVDVMALSDLSSKIATAEKNTAEHYVKLLELYPRNIRVLRDYARFLEEIVRDEKAAHEIWKKADKYEELEMEKATDSHRSAQNEKPITPQDREDDLGHSFEMKSDHTSETETSYDDKTETSKSSGVGSRIALARQEKNNKLKKLGWIMFFTTLFVLVVTFTQLGVLHNRLDDYHLTVENLDAAGGISHSTIRAASFSLDLYSLGLIATASNNPSFAMPWSATMPYPALSKAVMSTCNLLGNDVKSIYWGDSKPEPFTSTRRLLLKRMDGVKLWVDPTTVELKYQDFDHKMPDAKTIREFFQDPIWNQSMWIGNLPTTEVDSIAYTQYTTNKVDVWSMTMLLVDHAAELATSNLSYYSNLDSFNDLFAAHFYTMANAVSLTTAMRGLMELRTRNVNQKLNMLILEAAIIFAVSVVLMIFAAVVLFRPVVSEIYHYKIRTLYVFTLIPSSIVRHMAKKKISSLGHSDDEEAEVEVPHPPKYDEGARERWPDDEVVRNDPPMADSDDARSDGEADDENDDLPPHAKEGVVLMTPRAPPSDDRTLLPNSYEEDEEMDVTPGNPDDYISKKDEKKKDESSKAFPISRARTLAHDVSTSAKMGELMQSPSDPFPRFKKGDMKKASSNKNEIEMRPLRLQQPSKTASASKISLKIESDIRPRKVATVDTITDNVDDKLSPDSHSITMSEDHPSVKTRLDKFRKKLSPLTLSSESLPLDPKANAPSKEEREEEDEKDEKDGPQSTKQTRKLRSFETDRSRINVSSLKKATLKMHFSYVIAIGIIIFGLAITFVSAQEFIMRLKNISSTLKISDLRTQYAHLILFDLTVMYLGVYNNTQSMMAYQRIDSEIEHFWHYHMESVIPSDVEMMDLMYGDECLRINKTLCATPAYPYYDRVNQGLNMLVVDWFATAKELVMNYEAQNFSVLYSDPRFVELRVLGSNELLDGLELLTYKYFTIAIDQISDAKNQVGIIAAVESLVFVLIHLIFFRPFVKRLQEESEHTFSIIRMVPRSLVKNIPEIQDLIQDSMELD